MRALTIIEDDDGQFLIVHTPSESDTAAHMEMLHRAMLLVVQPEGSQ